MRFWRMPPFFHSDLYRYAMLQHAQNKIYIHATDITLIFPLSMGHGVIDCDLMIIYTMASYGEARPILGLPLLPTFWRA